MLVVIRPGDPGGGGMASDYVFSDQTLIAVTKGATHNFVDLPAGEQLIWCQGGGDLVDVVPGQTYYLVCGMFHGFSILDAGEGQALLAKTKPGPALSPKADGGAKKLLNRTYTGMRNSLEEFRAPFPKISAPSRPEDPAGRAAVPRYSRVTLELMENVSSAHSTTADRVGFRVVTASTPDGVAWVEPGAAAEGIVMFAKPSGRRGAAGILRLDIPSVMAIDATTVPVMGQLIGAGESRAAAATWGLAFGGFLGRALVSGRDVVYLAGERFDFWTRDEAWIRFGTRRVQERPPGAAEAIASVISPLQPSLLVERPPATVQIRIDTKSDVASVSIAEIGDWRLPRPTRATAVRKDEQGWVASFEGWSLLRHLRVTDGPMPVRFEVKLSDGKSVKAEATMSWQKGQ